MFRCFCERNSAAVLRLGIAMTIARDDYGVKKGGGKDKEKKGKCRLIVS